LPKIIENVREQLLTVAKKQVMERGYGDITIRSVAGACGLGVGTVYNYFPSKEMLIATFVYEDWKRYLNVMQHLPTADPCFLLKRIYGLLREFETEYERLFSDADAAKLVSIGFSGRHKMLRKQIAALVRPVCDSDFSSEFIAESLISWSMENADFDNLYPLFDRIIK